MPTYEYKCEKCDNNIILPNISIDDRDIQNCPECKLLLKRVYVIGNVSVWAPTAGGYR
jgi:hypothetical protein